MQYGGPRYLERAAAALALLPADRGARHRRRPEDRGPGRYRRHRGLVLPLPVRCPEPVRRHPGLQPGRPLLADRPDQLRAAEAALHPRHQHPAHPVPGQGGSGRGTTSWSSGLSAGPGICRQPGPHGPRPGAVPGSLHPAFDYGRMPHDTEIIQGTGAVFTSSLGRAVLRVNVGLQAEDNGVAATFTLGRARRPTFTWSGTAMPRCSRARPASCSPGCTALRVRLAASRGTRAAGERSARMALKLAGVPPDRSC